MENIREISEMLSPEELKQLEETKNKPIVFEEDCPEVTPEKAVRFKRVNPPRRVSGE